MELVLVSQTKCAPCKIVKKFLNSEDVEFTEVNISTHPELIDKYAVQSTPVTILMEDGEEIIRVGGADLDILSELVEQL